MTRSTAQPTPINLPKIIPLPDGRESYTQILGGPPENTCLKSGCVILEPGKSVGKHSTNEYEELIVPLEGEGELRMESREPLILSSGHVLYTPPHTTHDVVNTGTQALKYIYIVAKPG